MPTLSVTQHRLFLRRILTTQHEWRRCSSRAFKYFIALQTVSIPVHAVVNICPISGDRDESRPPTRRPLLYTPAVGGLRHIPPECFSSAERKTGRQHSRSPSAISPRRPAPTPGGGGNLPRPDARRESRRLAGSQERVAMSGTIARIHHHPNLDTNKSQTIVKSRGSINRR